MITNQLFKLFGKVTTIPNEYETRFQELITIASAVGVAASKYCGRFQAYQKAVFAH